MLEILKTRLKNRVVVVGIGNTLRSDDGAGSVLASRIKDRVSFKVINADTCPENYLEMIIRMKPATVIIIDAGDFGGSWGEFKVLDAKDLKATNWYSTHNASLALTIDYLQNNLEAVDIAVLMVQPKTIVFGDRLSSEVDKGICVLEDWFSRFARSLKS